MKTICAPDFYTAWLELLREVYCMGSHHSPRGINIKEVIGTQIHVTDLRNNIMVHPLRDLNYRFMVAEWLWIQAGRSDVNSIAKYNKNIANFSDNGSDFEGAYGPRLMRQWGWVIDALKKDPDTRQAVMTIFTPNPEPSKDIPCTLSLQVLERHGRLNGIVTMRSNDLWLGLPHDFFNFSQIVNGLAGEIGAEPGSMTLQAGSSHIYERDFLKVEALLAVPFKGYHVRSPDQPFMLSASAIYDSNLKDFHDPLEFKYANVLSRPNKKEALEALKILA